MLDAILEKNIKPFNSHEFLFPIGSMRAIKHLEIYLNNKLLLFQPTRVITPWNPWIICIILRIHSMAVFAHGEFPCAFAFLLKNEGAMPFCRMRAKALRRRSLLRFSLKDYPETSLLIREHVEGFSPGDILFTYQNE